MFDVPPQDNLVTIGERVGELATNHPDRAAVTSIAPNGSPTTLTWAELDRLTNIAAHGLIDRGADDASTLAIALKPGLDHVIATIAAFKIGALVIPLDPSGSDTERAVHRAAFGAHFLVSTVECADIQPGWWRHDDYSDHPLPRRTLPRSASLTGGTTGTPRVILRPRPWAYPRGQWIASHEIAQGMRLGQRQLLALPLYHTGFQALYQGLFFDHQIVIMERFAPSLFMRLIGEYRIQHVRMVAALMRMVLDVADLPSYDLSSLESVHHGAGPCPENVKRRWLELLGPERLYEVYACQERICHLAIRGDEWLRHPGSVGRPADGEVRVLHQNGEQARTGETGELYFAAKQPTYLGDGAPLAENNGFLSVGDLGYLDADGYLHLVDRKSSVINVGGAKVYPAEVEAVVLDLPEVADAMVTGRPHEYLGQSVHAMIVPADPAHPVTANEVEAHCRARLSTAKIPVSYEIVSSVRRSNGKLRRALISS